MKKIVFSSAALLLLASACHSQTAQQQSATPPAPQPAAQNQPATTAQVSGNAGIQTQASLILSSQEAAAPQALDCGKISSDQFLKLGDAVMGSLSGDEVHHAAMENMMGGENNPATQSVHIHLGQLYLGCKTGSGATMNQPATSSTISGATAMNGGDMGIASTSGDMNLIALRWSANNGEYLTDTQGMTLYTFAQDTAGTSKCNGKCVQAWPPYTTKATASQISKMYTSLSVMKRIDGSMQLSWKGMPLYYFTEDKKSVDTLGTAIKSWQIAKP